MPRDRTFTQPEGDRVDISISTKCQVEYQEEPEGCIVTAQCHERMKDSRVVSEHETTEYDDPGGGIEDYSQNLYRVVRSTHRPFLLSVSINERFTETSRS